MAEWNRLSKTETGTMELVYSEKFERVLRTGQGVMAGLGVKCYGRARFHMSCAKRCRDCC